MAQIFHPSTNTISKVSIFGGIFILAGLGWLSLTFVRSSYITQVGVPVEQPVPFSHEHHVRGLGIDCRYCHTSVETSSFAGIPPTETCMSCHSIIWNDSPMLEPVRESFRTNQSIRWIRVHNVPDFVYFDHSAHVSNGIGCESCHGRVDRMPLTWKAESFQMEWCLNCHRAPEKFIRPRQEVFTMGWTPPPDHDGLKLVADYGVQVEQLTNCSICHR
jgi:hypothetical protein